MWCFAHLPLPLIINLSISRSFIPSVFLCRVLSLVSQSDAVKAVAYMKKAISVDNSCIQAYDTLASVEIQK